MQLSQYLQTYYYPYLSPTLPRAAKANLAGAFSIDAKQKKREIRFEVSKNGGIFYHNPDKLLTQNANLPQSESEAKAAAMQALAKLNTNLSTQLSEQERKEIPYLYLPAFLRYESESLVKDPENQEIAYWKVNFFLELTVLGERQEIETPLSAMQDIRPQPLSQPNTPNARTSGSNPNPSTENSTKALHDFYNTHKKPS